MSRFRQNRLHFANACRYNRQRHIHPPTSTKQKPQAQKTKANGQVFRFLLLHLQGNNKTYGTAILLIINQNFNTVWIKS